MMSRERPVAKRACFHLHPLRSLMTMAAEKIVAAAHPISKRMA
jgi:hypothetical protein